MPVCALPPSPPLGRSQAASPGPAQREGRGANVHSPCPQPQPVQEETKREGTQVARLSAGRLDMRSWELLLLRMESWVPPFTPLLARDGCLCLKSMVK